MTTLTHTLLDATGTARVGVAVTLSVFDGNRYAENARWKAVATSGAGGALSWTIPADIHLNPRGTYFRITGAGITAPPVVLVKPGTVSTTVGGTSVGNSDSGGELPIRASAGSFVAGRVLNNNGTVNTQKKLTVKLTADGLSVEDLIIEDIA